MAALATLSAAARAQSGTFTTGALELLLPTGARTLGIGQAAVAMGSGTDGLWWNPAVIAVAPREAALHFAQSLATEGGSDLTASVLVPVRFVGAFALSIRRMDLGLQTGTDTSGNATGLVSTSSWIAAGTFATTFGSRISAGLTAKYYWVSFSCSGVCFEQAPSRPADGLLDLGLRYFARPDSVLTLGLAVRNLGFPVQFRDAPQADPTTRIGEFGIAVAPKLHDLPAGSRIQVGADAVRSLSPSVSGNGVGYRFGAELAVPVDLRGVAHGNVALRGGYMIDDPTGSGGSFGIGFSAQKWQVDLARTITDVKLDTGAPPTFLSLRYTF